MSYGGVAITCGAVACLEINAYLCVIKIKVRLFKKQIMALVNSKFNYLKMVMLFLKTVPLLKMVAYLFMCK